MFNEDFWCCFDRGRVGVCVFKIKLGELLGEMVKCEFFKLRKDIGEMFSCVEKERDGFGFVCGIDIE